VPEVRARFRLDMSKVKVQKTEQYVFACVKAQAVIVADKEREMLLAVPLLPKYEVWAKELLARPVSGKEVGV